MAKTITTIKTIATLGKRELRYTEMDGVKKFDIRAWHGEKYEEGVRFTEDEMSNLRDVMTGNIVDSKIGDKDLIVTDNGEYALSITINGRTYVRPFATHNEMNKLCEILKATDNLLEYDNTPKVEEPKKKRGRPKKSTDVVKEIPKLAEQKQKETKEIKKTEEKPKKSNILQFPKPKPEIEKMITKGNATYEQCEEKINAEKKIFVDSDSQYVLDGILELCKVDADFRNNLMRDDKSFDGALDYMGKMCQQGYGYKKGNYGFIDRDMGLGFTIDYFNLKPEEPKKSSTTTKKTTKKKA